MKKGLSQEECQRLDADLSAMAERGYMLEKLPPNLRGTVQSDELVHYGFELVNVGKVRDTWRVSPQILLQRASRRISVFDFVLRDLIPSKGEVLTSVTHFNATQGPLKDFPHHLLLDQTGFPAHRSWKFADNGKYAENGHMSWDLLKCTLAVQERTIMPYELIFRWCVGGSVWSSYQKTGQVAGLKLPGGLKKWDEMPRPFFTPSTKAEVGHDENISVQRYLEETGYDGFCVMLLMQEVFEAGLHYSASRGFALLDGKFEVSLGQVWHLGRWFPAVIADEFLTPDACRFTPMESLDRVHREGGEPEFYDKQPVRDYVAQEIGKKFGIPPKDLSHDNPEHVRFMQELCLPEALIQQTSERYLDFMKRYTGYSLNNYQRKFMGIG